MSSRIDELSTVDLRLEHPQENSTSCMVSQHCRIKNVILTFARTFSTSDQLADKKKVNSLFMYGYMNCGTRPKGKWGKGLLLISYPTHS